MTRYDFHSGQGEPFMREVPNGKWVLAEDVQQLEQRIELLREALKVAEDMLINEGYSSDDPCTLYGKNMQAIRAALKESE